MNVNKIWFFSIVNIQTKPTRPVPIPVTKRARSVGWKQHSRQSLVWLSPRSFLPTVLAKSGFPAVEAPRTTTPNSPD